MEMDSTKAVATMASTISIFNHSPELPIYFRCSTGKNTGARAVAYLFERTVLSFTGTFLNVFVRVHKSFPDFPVFLQPALFRMTRKKPIQYSGARKSRILQFG